MFSLSGSSWYMNGGGGQGVSSQGFHEQQFCVSQVTKQSNSVIIDLWSQPPVCDYIFPREATAGGSERTEEWSYIKRLKNEVKTNHQELVSVVWPK